MRQDNPVLVVAATEAEAAHVPDAVPIVITGIGKTAAAIATTRALSTFSAAELRVLQVINLGTAGALHDHLGGLHFPGAVINHDLNAEAIRALGFDPQERFAVPGGDKTVLATGDVFVSDPRLRRQLATRADLVDMEGYAVVAACRAFGVSCRLVKHVSDNADESALDWNTAVAHSARALGEWLVEFLDQG